MARPSVNHIEIDVTNLKKASKFYTSVLGLKVDILPMNYAMFKAGKGPGGGFNPVKKVNHGSTTVYFEVDNIPAYLKKAQKQGGKTLQKRKAIGGDMGYFGLFQDPFGNKIGLWSEK